MSNYIKKVGAIRSLRVNEVTRALREISTHMRPERREELLSICNALLAADCLALPEDDIAVGTDRYFDLPSVFAANEEVAGVVATNFPRLTEQNGGPVVPIDPNDFRFKINQGSQKKFGVELAPKPEFTPKPKLSTTDQYLEVCGRGKRVRISDISIEFVPTEDLKESVCLFKALSHNLDELDNLSFQIRARFPQGSKAREIDQSKYPSLRFSSIGQPICCMLCTRVNCKSLGRAEEEWKKLHAEPEPIKPEQLDPKACRQFVEHLVAFEELEAKRQEDWLLFLCVIANTKEISFESMSLFIENYKKC